MEGYAVVDEKGNKAWWDGKSITPIKAPANDSHDKFMADAGRDLNQMQQDVQHLSRPMETDRSNKPRFPKVEKVIETISGPALTAAAGFIPGSLPIQAAIGAGTEAIRQRANNELFNLKQIGISAATPAVARGVGTAVKTVARGAGKLFGEDELIGGAVSKVKSKLGLEKATKAADTAKAAAQANTTTFVPKETGKVVSEIANDRTGLGKKAFEEADGLHRAYVDAVKANDPLKYNELFTRAKNINSRIATAGDDEKEALIKLRKAINNDLDALGPEAQKYRQAYNRKAGIEEISSAIDKPTPGRKVREILDSDYYSKTFNANERKIAETVANQIGKAGMVKIGTALGSLGLLGYSGHSTEAGVGLASAVVMGALLKSPKIGAVMARSLVGPEGKINQAAIPALAQMVRGYMASPDSE